jgi:hypothetical protein
VKKLIMFSVLATALVAAPAVQAQMRHGPGMGHRGYMARARGGWFGNHGHMQAQRFQYRNHNRFASRGFRGNRNNYHTARYWAWGRGRHRGFSQNHRNRGWAPNNYRRPYQARGFGHYRQPYRPTAYGSRPGLQRGSRPAYGPGYRNHQNYRYNRPATTYRPRTGNYNGPRPYFSNPGTPGAITRTAATSSRPLGHGTGTWSHGSSRAAGGTWGGHTNSRFSSGNTSGGSAATVATD